MPRSSLRSPSITSTESYSAMIIADLVAEVPVAQNEGHNHEVKRRGSTPKSLKKVKKNLGKEESTENRSPVDLAAGRSNSDVSKGVLLNVVHFGQANDAQWVPFQKEDKTTDLKSKAMFISMSDLPDGSKSAPVPVGVEDSQMSIPRKIAFGFSFLPSILFVLCFSIILPCEKPELCVQETWSRILNGSGITSPLQNSTDILFTFSKENFNSVLSIDRTSGSIRWESSTDSRSRFIHCQDFDFNNDSMDDCLVLDESNKLYVFNTSNGALLWKHHVAHHENQTTSLPVILPNCTTDNGPKILVAVHSTTLNAFSPDGIHSTINISGCDTLPSTLTTWFRDEETDLIYYCKSGNEIGTLYTIPKEEFCNDGNHVALETIPLISRKIEDHQKLDLLPTSEGLVLWLEDYITLLKSDGVAVWELNTRNHSSEKRFIRQGKFNGKEEQIALFSSGQHADFQVTTVSLRSGNIAWYYYWHKEAVVNVAVLQGKRKDFALMITNEMKTHLIKQALGDTNEISTTILSYLNRTSITEMQKIWLLELDEDKLTHIIQTKELPDSLDDPLTSSIAYIKNEDETSSLIIIQAHSHKSNDQQLWMHLNNIQVKNWDLTNKKPSKCIWY